MVIQSATQQQLVPAPSNKQQQQSISKQQLAAMEEHHVVWQRDMSYFYFFHRSKRSHSVTSVLEILTKREVTRRSKSCVPSVCPTRHAISERGKARKKLVDAYKQRKKLQQVVNVDLTPVKQDEVTFVAQVPSEKNNLLIQPAPEPEKQQLPDQDDELIQKPLEEPTTQDDDEDAENGEQVQNDDDDYFQPQVLRIAPPQPRSSNNLLLLESPKRPNDVEPIPSVVPEQTIPPPMSGKNLLLQSATPTDEETDGNENNQVGDDDEDNFQPQVVQLAPPHTSDTTTVEASNEPTVLKADSLHAQIKRQSRSFTSFETKQTRLQRRSMFERGPFILPAPVVPEKVSPTSTDDDMTDDCATHVEVEEYESNDDDAEFYKDLNYHSGSDDDKDEKPLVNVKPKEVEVEVKHKLDEEQDLIMMIQNRKNFNQKRLLRQKDSPTTSPVLQPHSPVSSPTILMARNVFRTRKISIRTPPKDNKPVENSEMVSFGNTSPTSSPNSPQMQGLSPRLSPRSQVVNSPPLAATSPRSEMPEVSLDVEPAELSVDESQLVERLSTITMFDKNEKPKPRFSIAVRGKSAKQEFKDTPVAQEISNMRSAAVKILPELSFDVVKMHRTKFGTSRRLNRTLKVTANEIWNCHRNGKPTKKHSFELVQRLMLVDTNQFTIEYDSKDCHHYESAIAMQVVQLITSRLNKNKKYDEITVDDNLSVKYQMKVLEDNKQENTAQQAQPVAVAQQQVDTTSIKNSTAFKILNATISNVQGGDKEEIKMWAAAKKQCLDNTKNSKIEYKSIKSFIQNFTLLEKNPASVSLSLRQFMNGMRDYILQKKEATLEQLLVQASKKSATLTPKEINTAGLVDRLLQKSIIVPLASRLEKCLYSIPSTALPGCNEPLRQSELKLMEKKKRLKGKSQEFFGVPLHVRAPELVWQPAVKILSTMDSVIIPSEKVDILLATARAIYSSHNEFQASQDAKKALLSGDDFLPLFIYIIQQSTVQKPLLLVDWLYELGDPQSMGGETGYYLCTYSSAVSYLLNINEETGELLE